MVAETLQLEFLVKMQIGITGVTGLIGKKLASLARAQGHRVVGFSRSPHKKLTDCEEVRLFSTEQPVDLSGLDAVIHLAGEPVIGLWTREKRRRIVASRRDTTRHLVTAMGELTKKPAVFLCASGTGFYGHRGPERLGENAGPGHGFLAEVAQVWEAEAEAAQEFGIRTCQLRTGLVVARDGGGFLLQRRAFSLGLGGKIGSGQQFLPWIHLDDVAALYLHCLGTGTVSGPVNAVAPEECTNLVFTQTLARVLGRPAFFSVPAWGLRLALGDLASIVLDSQRAVPERAVSSGFQFAYPTLAEGFKAAV